MILAADAARIPLADKSVDLVLGSPPYMDARTYGIGADRKCQEWIDWMLIVTREALRVTRGLVLWVVGGVTRDRCYWPGPEGLLYSAWRAGMNCLQPCVYHRQGIPGSGGDQWLRRDTEYCLAFSASANLPFSDNTINGHKPKFSRTRAMTNRKSDGKRTSQIYVDPPCVNPGNLIHCAVGGGQIGDALAHESEAPFPEKLAEFFIAGWCPPGGTVLDPFSGSGTTAKVALANGRRYIASDIRLSQCQLTRRRLEAGITPHGLYA
jgi:hypothetical protein